jgi:hypothetical protein
VQKREMKQLQLRYSTSAAAADGLTRDPRAHAQQLVRRLERSDDAALCEDPLAALADFLTALRSPDGDAVAAAAAAPGVIEALERMLRGEVDGKDRDSMQALAACALARLIHRNGGAAAALARCITDKGAMIVGQGRGCSGAAALKVLRREGHTCAGFLAESAYTLRLQELVWG